MAIITDARNAPMSQLVDEILHYQWDPLRIAGLSGMRDEYPEYADDVFRLLRDNASATQIYDYLVAAEEMILDKPITLVAKIRLSRVIDLLLEMKDWSAEHETTDQ